MIFEKKYKIAFLPKIAKLKIILRLSKYRSLYAG